MQFDIDCNSSFATVFLGIRELLFKHNLKEKKRENITSYFSEEGGICYLKTTKEGLIVGIFKGSQLDGKYPFINKGQKVIRHLYLNTLTKKDLSMVENIVNDSIILNIESSENKRVKRR